MNRREAGKLRGIQRRLERFYGIEQTPDVVPFVQHSSEQSRETVLVRHDGEENMEIALVLPEGALKSDRSHDLHAQVLEGVSHFVYLAERARMGLPLTQLELELQAEVDKFVLLGLELESEGKQRLADLHQRLFENVRFLHEDGSEAGMRYRLANGLAARFVARSVATRGIFRAREQLRRFYRSGQTDKIRLAQVA